MSTQHIAEQGTSVASPVLKAGTALGAAGAAKGVEHSTGVGQMLGIASWADAASALAFIYTACLLGEWLWKKFGRPLAERRCWLKRLQRRKEDHAPNDDTC